MGHSKPYPVRTVAQATARLSEILRLAEKEGPQRIGARKAFIVVPAHTWRSQTSHRKPLGDALIAGTSISESSIEDAILDEINMEQSKSG